MTDCPLCGELGSRPRYDLPHPENRRSSPSVSKGSKAASRPADAKRQEPT